MPIRKKYLAISSILLIAAIFGNTASLAQSTANAADALDNGRISPFSGLHVPRFASLGYSQVNGRTGPGMQYPVKWRYVRMGLPVLVIRESPEWRKIRDPDGEEVWIHKRMLNNNRRMAIVVKDSALFALSDHSQTKIAQLHPGVIAEIANCSPKWCKTSIDKFSGQIAPDALWGDTASRIKSEQ